MLKTRLIPVVLLRDGRVVQSKGFRRYQVLGNPTTIVERLSDWASDEMIYLDISRGGASSGGRNDLKGPNRSCVHDIIADVATAALMPMTVGGGIRSLAAAQQRVRAGADKITLNTGAIRQPDLIDTCARHLGSQCVVVSIDAARGDTADYRVHADGGREDTGRCPLAWAREAVERGAGEILLNAIDRDGRGGGYDLDLVDRVADAVSVPVIALGGVGCWSHFVDAIRQTRVSAVAAANIFHYTENSVCQAKRFLFDAGCNVRRPPELCRINATEEAACVIASDVYIPR